MSALFLRSALTVLGLSVVIVTVLVGIAHADPVAPGEEHCVVNIRSNDTLNMRERPSSHAAIVARKRHDDCGILAHECAGAWCSVEDGHRLGWVHRHFIAMISPAMYCVSGVAKGDVLNLRAFPSPQSRVVARLNRHQCDIAFLPYSVGIWQKIRVDGRQGWANQQFLSGE